MGVPGGEYLTMPNHQRERRVVVIVVVEALVEGVGDSGYQEGPGGQEKFEVAVDCHSEASRVGLLDVAQWLLMGIRSRRWAVGVWC